MKGKIFARKEDDPTTNATFLLRVDVPLRVDKLTGAPRQEGESAWRYRLRRLFTVKSIKSLDEDYQASKLKKSLNVFDLIMIGIGGIIGNGIFVLAGQAAATRAGPGVVISILLAGLTASFAALSYSELASMIPISGSSYTYTYATLGELIAWIIGWDLTLEYLVGASAVAVGWSGYFRFFFIDAFGVELSSAWTESPFIFNSTTSSFQTVPGIKESARFATFVVSVKLIVIFLFIIAAGTRVHNENFHPFIPQNQGSFSSFGVTGVLSGATVVFFAYIGFDAISTIAQESENPQKDLPVAILGSFSIVTFIYVAVCVVLTGVVSYTQLDSPAPLSVAVNAIGMRWLGIIVDIGAVIGLTSVILITLMGQPRIFMAMANDGLIPKFASNIHPKFGTPYVITIITGTIASIAAAFLPIDVLAELMSVGTLLAFFLVNVGVTILRFTAPDAPRKFRVPGGPFLIPFIGAALSILLIATATVPTIARLFIWMAIGLVVYALYGSRRSEVNNQEMCIEKATDRIET
ncbi:3190_t:CDS:2 [Cetraspora pellucida]|uniref:3190_t:CDS:1 n=1 Tax=Cetraspora pellucida TaxID=1433469 RepID=A0A9N9A8D3_9GLOM|nr:3190_t:CDS:2 [Cetraspora pellucida]